jgi:quercetin dioxygenase-like cupin family protein
MTVLATFAPVASKEARLPEGPLWRQERPDRLGGWGQQKPITVPEVKIMNGIFSTVLLALITTCISVASVGQESNKNKEFSELQRAKVVDANDIEVVMGLIERAGASVSSKHYHPGGEFGFVIEGSITIARENQPDRILNPGDSFHQGAGEWHIVGTASEGAKTLVFRLVARGLPMVVVVE